jgi:dGTPase
MGLNEELTECLVLGHDLGHTPFGHSGERVMNELMRDHGGFEHNRQTLRILEVLERRYPEFPGLNLTWEVREGIAKHSGTPDVARFPEAAEYDPAVPPPVEAQMIDLVDEIAYNHHDIDDGLESRLLEVEDLAGAVPLFGRAYREAARRWPAQGERMWVKIALRGVIDALVSDLVGTTRSELTARNLRSVDDVRAQERWLAALSPPVAAENRALKRYLHEKLYRHPRILETKRHLAEVLKDLFSAYAAQPAEMPDRYAALAGSEGAARAACDYLAGMTDRFALQ